MGGTLIQNRFADFLLTTILMEMLWSDLNTKQYRRISANNNTIDRHWWDLNTKPLRRFPAKDNTIERIGKTLPQNQFADIFANTNTYGHALVGP